MNAFISDITVPSDGQPVKERILRAISTLPPNTVPNTLRVFLVREPFDDYYLLINQNGHSEEMDEESVRAWLAERGASEDLIQQSVTQAWNFYSAMVTIKNPRVPVPKYDPLAPQISL